MSIYDFPLHWLHLPYTGAWICSILKPSMEDIYAYVARNQ